MGRITIFALHECPHCKRTKAALTVRNIPYTEISISDYPDKRSDMLALADRLTVPQVFFNDKHIGGADDTLALLEKWDQERKYPTALERYEAEVSSVDDAPKDERLQVPTTPPVLPKPEPPRNLSDAIELPNSSKMSILEVTKRLIEGMPKSSLGYRGKYYLNSFTGKEAVSFLMKEFNIELRVKAVEFGLMLQKRHLFQHVSDDHKLEDVDNLYYRLQAFQEPLVLNSFRKWTDRVDPDAAALLIRLKKIMGKVESDCTDENGLLDYVAATKHEKYFVFEEAVCELQKINIESMSSDEKLAFGINLYNLMIKHAFMKVGIPNGALGRSSFFNSVGYDIGGLFYNFSELENGILRGNKKAPGQFSVPFADRDPRKKLVLEKADPRIHFALNCGAKSCPPVKKFSATAINEELRIVAQAFCEQEDNVFVDEKSNTLKLTKIMSWYGSDFSSSSQQLPEAIVPFLRGESQEKLLKMIESNKKIKIIFFDYDWGTNASNSVKFDKSSLSLTKIGLTF